MRREQKNNMNREHKPLYRISELENYKCYFVAIVIGEENADTIDRISQQGMFATTIPDRADPKLYAEDFKKYFSGYSVAVITDGDEDNIKYAKSIARQCIEIESINGVMLIRSADMLPEIPNAAISDIADLYGDDEAFRQIYIDQMHNVGKWWTYDEYHGIQQ